MCKYCEFTYVDENERTNEVQHIMKIQEGRLAFEISLYRYQSYDNPCENTLMVEESIDLDGDVNTVTNKHIEIKYCPFCGEKL